MHILYQRGYNDAQATKLNFCKKWEFCCFFLSLNARAKIDECEWIYLQWNKKWLLKVDLFRTTTVFLKPQRDMRRWHENITTWKFSSAKKELRLFDCMQMKQGTTVQVTATCLCTTLVPRLQKPLFLPLPYLTQTAHPSRPSPPTSMSFTISSLPPSCIFCTLPIPIPSHPPRPAARRLNGHITKRNRLVNNSTGTRWATGQPERGAAAAAGAAAPRACSCASHTPPPPKLTDKMYKCLINQ